MSCLVVEVSLEVLTGVNRSQMTLPPWSECPWTSLPLFYQFHVMPCWSTPLDPLWGLWVPTTPLAWSRQIFARCQVSAKLAARLGWCLWSLMKNGMFCLPVSCISAVFQCRWHHVSLHVTVVWCLPSPACPPVLGFTSGYSTAVPPGFNHNSSRGGSIVSWVSVITSWIWEPWTPLLCWWRCIWSRKASVMLRPQPLYFAQTYYSLSTGRCDSCTLSYANLHTFQPWEAKCM